MLFRVDADGRNVVRGFMASGFQGPGSESAAALDRVDGAFCKAIETGILFNKSVIRFITLSAVGMSGNRAVY